MESFRQSWHVKIEKYAIAVDTKTRQKEKVSQRQRNTPNTSVAVEVAVKGEATVEDQKKKEKYRREAARKRAGVSFLRLRDSTPWKCEGQSVLGKKD